MRLGNLDGRLVIVSGPEDQLAALDVHTASDGLFESDPQAIYDRWAEFRDWATRTRPTGFSAATDGAAPLELDRLRAPVPAPRQVFAVGLNYRDHAAEAGVPLPEVPAVFTKYPTSLTGPTGTIVLPRTTVDWEVELVVVVGARTHQVSIEQAWDHLAGVTVGQDLSERTMQMAGPVPQFGLAKSFPGFSPIGPWVVTPEDLPDRDDLALTCTVNGEPVQDSRTSQLVFDVPTLVAELSAVLPLLPGDLIFTGTPAGVGVFRTPPRFLQPGDVLVSTVEGIGSMSHRTEGPR